jgi:HEAT repeat protein
MVPPGRMSGRLSGRLLGVLTDLDRVPWAQLAHAYGEATDVPDLLRGLANGDGEALSDLFGNIWHQGTVYSATAYAVPFLIELLDAPAADVAGVLGLLSAIADGSSYHEVHQDLEPRSRQGTPELLATIAKEKDWVRAAAVAVAAGSPTYARLLASHDDEQVRAWAAHTISKSVGAGDIAVPTVLGAAERDASPLVRASAILAADGLGVATPERVTGWLADAEPLPRLAAALAATDSQDGPGPEVAAVLERDAASAVATMKDLPWVVIGGDPLDWVGRRLDERWDLQVRLLRSWLAHDNAELRSQAVYACEMPIHRWRPAAALLIPALATCLSDPDREVRRLAARQLAGAGRQVAVVADQLWAVVRPGPKKHTSRSAYALTALCRIRDPRAAAYLATRLGADEVVLSDLGKAIELIDSWAAPACLEPLIRLVSSEAGRPDRIDIIAAVGRLCVGAEDATRERAAAAVRGQLSSFDRVSTRVLGDLGPPAAMALDDLRAMLGNKDAFVRINAARALWRIGGEVGAAVSTLGEVIPARDRVARGWALRTLGELGPAGAELSGLLPPLFESDDRWTELQAATAYWCVTGDHEPVVPILLRHVAGNSYGLIAVRCLADIGPPAAAAVPVLRRQVTSEYRQITSGSSDEWVHDDEQWSDACAAALDRIT